MPLTLDDYVVQVPEKPVWYKRNSTLLAGVVVVVVGASVLSDLPSKVTPAADASAQTTLMNEINKDVAGCAYGTKETFTIYRDLKAKTLSKSNLSIVPSMLNDDHNACSLTSGTLYDLANIQGTGSAAGKRILNLANIALTWATYDAQTAIIDVIEIMNGHPKPGTFTSLAHAESLLKSDRAAAIADLNIAAHDVRAKLPALGLPSLAPLPGVSSRN